MEGLSNLVWQNCQPARMLPVDRDLAIAVGEFSIAFARLDGTLARVVRDLRQHAYPGCIDVIPIYATLGRETRIAQFTALAEIVEVDAQTDEALRDCARRIQEIQLFADSLRHERSADESDDTQIAALARRLTSSCWRCQQDLSRTMIDAEFPL